MTKTTTKPIADLALDPTNARKRTDANRDAIGRSLKRFGAGRSIVLDGDDTIRAGNGTVEQAKEQGFTEVVVVEPGPNQLVAVKRPEWTDEEAAAYAVADNQSALLAEWDSEQLVETLQGMKTVELADVGFTDRDLVQFMAKNEVEEDEVPEPPKAAVTKPGDVWQLGRHRVVCGDAFTHDPGHVGAVLTDPPYGMALDPDYNAMFAGIDGHHKSATFEKVLGDEEPPDLRPLFERLGKVREQFWFGADYYRASLPAGGSWVVWDKRTENLDRLPGSSFELAWSKQKHKRLMARVLWSGHHGMQNDDTPTRVHPTQKPTELVRWFLERWVDETATIYDPFLGSGTTLIAAEQLDRTCYGIEIEPRYVDVVVERWQQLTGGKAKRVDNIGVTGQS